MQIHGLAVVYLRLLSGFSATLPPRKQWQNRAHSFPKAPACSRTAYEGVNTLPHLEWCCLLHFNFHPQSDRVLFLEETVPPGDMFSQFQLESHAKAAQAVAVG